jgi:hypothetical protein
VTSSAGRLHPTVADFVGYWKITAMEQWDIEYIDLIVPGFIEFEREGEHLMGQFQFGAVGGWLDCRVTEIEGEPRVEWSWEGHNDRDPACGRGWATIRDSRLLGHLFIHSSDDSTFEAVRKRRPRRARRPQ